MLELQQTVYRRDGFELTCDVRLSPGKTYAVLGRSGSGKSTLLNLIAGFEPLVAGRMSLDGMDITSASPAMRKVNLVMQDNNTFPHLTLRQNVALGISTNLKLNAPQWDAVDQALAKLGLLHLAQRKPSAVSGGERQRVALARVLVREASVLLLDEPFAALDPGLRFEMLQLVTDLTQEHGLVTLLVSHQPDEVLQVVRDVLFVNQGIVQGPLPRETFLADIGTVARHAYLGQAKPTW